METRKPEFGRPVNGDQSQGNGARPEPHPLDNVLAPSMGESIVTINSGLFNMGRNRALQSGTTEPLQEDIAALESHARAVAQETYRDKYDPTKFTHDRMTEVEYEKLIADRRAVESAEGEAAANARDAEERLAQTPKAGDKPVVRMFLVILAALVIALTVAPTLHDFIFRTLDDDLLAHFFSFLSAGCVGALITWAILSGRRTTWRWAGLLAGIVLGIGLGIVRLSAVEGTTEVLFGIGLTVVELSVVLLLEWYALGLRAAEDEWKARQDIELVAIATADAARSEHSRRVERLQKINDAIVEKISHVEERHHRNDVARLEAAAVKAVLDGYNAGIAENRGHVIGVTRRRNLNAS
jgi:hypothetical protein